MAEPNIAVSLQASCRLSEDYLLTDNILIDTGGASPLASIALGDGEVTALAVVAGSGLCQLYLDPSSASGWNLKSVSGGANALEVVAALDAQNTLHAFFQDGTATYHVTLGSNGIWSQPQSFPPAQNLGLARVPISNDLIAFGFTPDGNLLWMQPSGAESWSAATVDFGGALSDAQGVVQMTSASAWVLAVANGGAFQLYSGGSGGVASGPETVALPNPAQRVHFAYQHSNSTMIMVSDNTNVLYTSAGFSNQMVAIDNSSVLQGSAIVGEEGLIRFYGVAPDGKLWILNQVGWNGAAPVWADIFPLDVNAYYVAAPLSTSRGADIFALGVDQTVHYLTQDAQTRLWQRDILQAPHTSVPYQLTRYRTQITALGPNQSPAPQVALTISSSIETALVYNNVTYFVGPDEDQTATFTTNAMGTVTFSCPSTSLSSPVFTVTGADEPVQVAPYQYLQDFLAGAGSINTGSAAIAPMSADTLMSATVNGQPLAPGLTSDLATVAAQGISSAALTVPAVDESSPAALKRRARTAAGWVLDLRDRERPVYREFATRAELQSYRKEQRAARESTSGSISHFFGDVWNSIQNGAMEVVQWVVDTAESVVNLTVRIAGEMVELGEMIIDSIEDAIAVVHSIFQAIGAALRTVVSWLRDLFAWHDVWNTTQVVAHCFAQAQAGLEYMIEDMAIPAAQQVIETLKERLDTAFENMISHFGGISFAQVVSPQDPAAASSGMAIGANSAPPGSSSAQNNWMLAQTSSNVSGGTLGQITGTLPSNVFADLRALFMDPEIQADIRNAGKSLQAFVEVLLEDPGNFATAGVADFLRGCQSLVDLALDLASRVLTSVLETIADSLQGIWEILQQPLEIPVLSWLWTQVVGSDQPLTLLNLASLLVAFPATVGYKLANNMAAPFSDTETQSILAYTFNPGVPPGSAAAAEALSTGIPMSSAARGSLQLAASALLSIADSAIDILGTSLSMLPKEEMGPIRRQLEEAVRIAGWADVMMISAAQVFSWPEDILSGPLAWSWELGSGAWFLNGTWIGGWVPLLINFGLLGAETTNLELFKSPIMEASEWGKAVQTACGCALLVTGTIGATIKFAEDSIPSNGWNVGSALLSPLAYVFQIICMDEVVLATDSLSVAVKVFIDLFCDMGAGATQYMSTTLAGDDVRLTLARI